MRTFKRLKKSSGDVMDFIIKIITIRLDNRLALPSRSVHFIK